MQVCSVVYYRCDSGWKCKPSLKWFRLQYLWNIGFIDVIANVLFVQQLKAVAW